MNPGWVLFDWGDTLMVDFDDYEGPMAGWPRVEAMPHARETLMELRAHGWHIALATNAQNSDSAEIRVALARVDLDVLIDRFYCSSEVGHDKPSLEYYQFILDDLGVDPASAVMLGDHLRADVLGANEAGIRAVWLSPDGWTAPADPMRRTVSDLSQVPGVLDSWS